MFIKQDHQEGWRQKINNKKRKNNYFRAGISQKVEQVLKLKEKKPIEF